MNLLHMQYNTAVFERKKKFVGMVARKIMLFGADARWRDGRRVVTNKLIYGRYSMSERQR